MPDRKKAFEQQLAKVLGTAAMAVYLEPEQKLDATCPDTLKKVEDFIVADPYFELLNLHRMAGDIPKDIALPHGFLDDCPAEYAHQVTPTRFRVYYDTPALDGFHRGVEIRIEHPGPTEHGHKNPYKQVVKIGGPATSEDHTFHRLEISGRLAAAIPNTKAESLDDNEKLSSLLKKHIKTEKLRPLQLLVTTRTRIWCHPNGDPDTIVEFGIDRGQGITVDGYKYPIWQIEPELIRGSDAAVLNTVSERLMDRFEGALAVNLTSKPTPGYNHLAHVLEQQSGMKARIQRLPVQQFNVLPQLEA